MNHDVEKMLHDLGSSPVPPPSQAFADNLESDLRVLVANSSAASFGPRFGRWPATIAALGFTVAVVVFALVSLNSGPTEIYIGPVSDAEVILPTGERFAASPGVALPEGALVITGEAGSVTIGDKEFGPNSNVLVVDDDVASVGGEEVEALVDELPSTSVPEPTLAAGSASSGSPTTAAGPANAPSTTTVGDSVVTTEPIATTIATTTTVSTEPVATTTTVTPINVTPEPTVAPTTLLTTTTRATEPTLPPETTEPLDPDSTSTTSPTTTELPPDVSSTTTTEGQTSTSSTTTEVPDPNDPGDTSTTTTEPDSTSTTTSSTTSSTTTTEKLDGQGDADKDQPESESPAVRVARDPVTGRIIGEILEDSRILIRLFPELVTAE